MTDKCHSFRAKFTQDRSPLPGACNSHAKPMSRRFYRQVYFLELLLISFSCTIISRFHAFVAHFTSFCSLTKPPR